MLSSTLPTRHRAFGSGHCVALDFYIASRFTVKMPSLQHFIIMVFKGDHSTAHRSATFIVFHNLIEYTFQQDSKSILVHPFWNGYTDRSTVYCQSKPAHYAPIKLANKKKMEHRATPTRV